MLRKLSLALCCSAALLASACAGERPETKAVGGASPTPAAPTKTAADSQAQQLVKASAAETRVPAGGTTGAVVRLDIADGYHVNANPPSDKFYIGTEIRAAAQDGLTPGRAVYPAGEAKKFGFSEEPLKVYEGGVIIRLPLSAGPQVEKGRRTFAAKVRVQPCNDEACLPPREVNADIPVVIE
jgi:uncharacterized protein